MQKADVMDRTEYCDKNQIKQYLKVLLFQLASGSEHPSYDLEVILQEAINELHHEVKDALKQKRMHLKLVNELNDPPLA